MNILIKNENISRIQAAIDAAQPRARVRTIDAHDVLYAVERIEAATAHISAKSKKGLRYLCDPWAQKFPSCYKGVPESTRFTLEHTGRRGSWRLVDVSREKCTSGAYYTALNAPGAFVQACYNAVARIY